jgi:hypothetical protein
MAANRARAWLVLHMMAFDSQIKICHVRIQFDPSTADQGAENTPVPSPRGAESRAVAVVAIYDDLAVVAEEGVDQLFLHLATTAPPSLLRRQPCSLRVTCGPCRPHGHRWPGDADPVP